MLNFYWKSTKQLLFNNLSGYFPIYRHLYINIELNCGSSHNERHDNKKHAPGVHSFFIGGFYFFLFYKEGQKTLVLPRHFLYK